MIKTEFQRQGNFTICVLADVLAERLFVGATVCAPDDTYNQEIGEAIAEGRAMNSRADYYAKAAFAK